MRKKGTAGRVGKRVRETAPAYAPEAADVQDVHTVSMGARGRVVLPAAVRERLNIQEGDRLTLRVEPDGTLKLQTPAVFARSLVGAFAHLAPGRRFVDELIADRRREAAKEERETRAFLARLKKRRR